MARHEHWNDGHYSVAEIKELGSALEAIAHENGRANRTLRILRLEATKHPGCVSPSPHVKQKG